jgi:CysZ protein
MGQGMDDVGRAFAFLNAHPRLWKWVVMPACVSLVLLVLLAYGVANLAGRAADSAASHLPHFLAGAVHTVVFVLLLAALAAGALMIYAALAKLISGPFCEQLSEAVEVQLNGKEPRPFALPHYLKELGRGAGHALQRLLMAVVVAFGLFALSFIPVIGAIAAVLLGGYFAARATAYDCYDAVFGRRQMAYTTKHDILRMHRARSMGLGATVAAMLLVPGINLVAIGIGSVGATLAMYDIAPNVER